MLITIAALGSISTVVRSNPSTPTPSGRPNIIFILIDDMRWDTMSCAGHPFVKTPHMDRIAEKGTRFTNAFVTISLCSPSRACFLTGTYAHTHKVRVNEQCDPDPALPTFPQLLQRAGYETAYVGKWHMKPSPEPRPGFDYWLGFRGQGQYIDPELNENGRNFKATGYMTDLLTQYAVDFLKRPHSKPFCLCLSHKAVHGPFTPAKRHEHLYDDVQMPEPVSFSDTYENKPEWIRTGITLGEIRQWRRDARYRPVPAKLKPSKWNPRNKERIDWFRCLAAVDDSVGRVLDTLEEIQAAENTVIIFTSDNGFFHGEHRRGDKRLAYDESLRIPLLVCGPGVAKAGTTADQMVLNIDVAPTILDFAGVEIPQVMQGRSFKPLLAGQPLPWRNSFFYEYFQENWLPGIPTITAVRTTQWKYVRYPLIEDLDELYDLTKDPYELKNLANDPSAGPHLAEMQAELDRLMKETGYTPREKVTPVHRPGKLVLHYDFEGDGQQIVDRSGHGNDTSIGSLARVKGRSGQALRCDGQGAAEIVRSSSLDPSGKPWTVSLWVKPEKRRGVILASGGSSQGYALTLWENTVEFGMRSDGDFLSPVSYKVLGTDWVHILGTITAERVLQIYVDGKLTGSIDADSFITTRSDDTIQIGADSGPQVYPEQIPPFTGLIDDLKIFDGAHLPDGME